MIPVHVALVDETGRVDPQELAIVAGALNKQVQDDFLPIWKTVPATVGVYPQPMPGQWTIIIQDHLDEPGALGYHTSDRYNQPLAYVAYDRFWAITASHELLEMLADPFGNRIHDARLPAGLEKYYRSFGLAAESSHVLYVLEVCDPCEMGSYEVAGVQMSDFLLPGWYRTSPLLHPAYSHTGLCRRPREIALGGYASFANRAGEWFQVMINGSGHVSAMSLGHYSATKFGSLRNFTDYKARTREGTKEVAL